MTPSLLLYDRSCVIRGSRVCSLWAGADGPLWGAPCGFSCRLASISHCVAVGSRCAGTWMCEMGAVGQEWSCGTALFLLAVTPAGISCQTNILTEGKPWGGMEFWLRTLGLLENAAFSAWIKWDVSACLYLLQWKKTLGSWPLVVTGSSNPNTKSFQHPRLEGETEQTQTLRQTLSTSGISLFHLSP